MDNLKLKKEKEEKQTASAVIQSEEFLKNKGVNEEVLDFSRGGRKGRAVAAQLENESRNSNGLISETVSSSKNKKYSPTSSEVFRVVISKNSNEYLEQLLLKCSEGFENGSISKSDIANYVFQNINRFFQDSDIKALRSLHFDEKKMLSSILKNESDIPEELRKAIRAHYGLGEKEKKRSIRSNGELSTDSSVDNSKT